MAGQSLELTRFYQAYQAWMNSGAEGNHTFQRSYGLCRCLYRWYLFSDDYITDRYTELNMELINQFEEADLDPKWPFGGRDTFLKESDLNTMHINEHRRAWVTLHA